MWGFQFEMALVQSSRVRLKMRGVGVRLKKGFYMLMGNSSPLSANRLLSTLSLLAMMRLGVSLPKKIDSMMFFGEGSLRSDDYTFIMRG
jgi:hypothetical protein